MCDESESQRPGVHRGPLRAAPDVNEERSEVPGADPFESERLERRPELLGSEDSMARPERGRQALPDSSLEALEVRHDERQASAGTHQPQVFLDDGARVVEMLDESGDRKSTRL